MCGCVGVFFGLIQMSGRLGWWWCVFMYMWKKVPGDEEEEEGGRTGNEGMRE